MKHKTAELEGALLDLAVAQALDGRFDGYELRLVASKLGDEEDLP